MDTTLILQLVALVPPAWQPAALWTLIIVPPVITLFIRPPAPILSRAWWSDLGADIWASYSGWRARQKASMPAAPVPAATPVLTADDIRALVLEVLESRPAPVPVAPPPAPVFTVTSATEQVRAARAALQSIPNPQVLAGDPAAAGFGFAAAPISATAAPDARLSAVIAAMRADAPSAVTPAPPPPAPSIPRLDPGSISTGS